VDVRLAGVDFPPFGKTVFFFNDEVTRVVTCFAPFHGS